MWHPLILSVYSCLLPSPHVPACPNEASPNGALPKTPCPLPHSPSSCVQAHYFPTCACYTPVYVHHPSMCMRHLSMHTVRVCHNRKHGIELPSCACTILCVQAPPPLYTVGVCHGRKGGVEPLLDGCVVQGQAGAAQRTVGQHSCSIREEHSGVAVWGIAC